VGAASRESNGAQEVLGSWATCQGDGEEVGLTIKTAGIPRLQELSFLEVAAVGVAEGLSFEEIRRRQVAHMIALREAAPGTGNTATYQLALENPQRYVSNATESLKELMRLGLVLQATLPSSASAARSYRNTRFSLSDEGSEWVELVTVDPRHAYDQLMSMLWRLHPQFAAYVTAIQPGLVVPLAQWGEAPEPRTRESYVRFLVDRVVDAIRTETLGWSASESEVRDGVHGYLKERYEAAAARDRPDPYPRNQDFINAVEEALVKLVFAKCGTPIDYISQEVLRRWTKELGVANFSYHTTGPTALRYWSTAELTITDSGVRAQRRTGEKYLDQAAHFIGEAFERVKRDDDSRSLWVPIHRVRAETCWRLRLPDALFDRALIELLSGVRGDDLPFRINVDPAMYGNVPPSELPLRVETSRGVRTYYSMSLVARRPEAKGSQGFSNERRAP
jgi:hypothetical protein